LRPLTPWLRALARKFAESPGNSLKLPRPRVRRTVTRKLPISHNCVFDASLVPETCLEFPSFANLMQDSIRKAKADMRLRFVPDD